MLRIGGKGPNCSKCVELWGFRSVCILFIGLTIGWVGLQFVATPPSVALLAESKEHQEQTTEIIKRLDTVEQLVMELKADVKKIKDEIVKPEKRGRR